MDVVLILSRLLQLGLGIFMVVVGNGGRRRTYTGNRPGLWKLAVWVCLVWGWMMSILSAYSLLAYLLFYGASH